MAVTTPWFRTLLEVARDIAPPDHAIGAGAVRTLVWDALSGATTPTPLRDVDLVFFDPHDLRRDRDAELARALAERHAAISWDVTNQAAVHLWYGGAYGLPVEPLASLADAIATWPETATCVGVRLEQDDRITVIAPLGLDDLFAMVLRWNARRATREQFDERVQTKALARSWPAIRVA